MRGTTLVELMVTLVVLGIVATVGLVAVASLSAPRRTEREDGFAQARSAAIRTGRPVALLREDGSLVRFLPDGRAVGSGVDQLTGDVVHATR